MAEAADLCLAHLNIRSLESKTNVIQRILTDLKIHVLALTETHLNDSVEGSVHIKNFRLYRKDRNRHGGGVGFYINNDITVKPRFDLDHEDLEMIWIEISLDDRPVLVGCCYRTSSSKIAYLNKICRKIEVVSNEDKGIFLLGDFNIDWLKESAKKMRIDFASSLCGLAQIIKTPTRETQSTSTCIDHIYTNISELHSKSVIPQVNTVSDHKLITVTLQRRVLRHRNTETDPLSKHFESLNFSKVSQSKVYRPLKFRTVEKEEVERLLILIDAHLLQNEAPPNAALICQTFNSCIKASNFSAQISEDCVSHWILEKILLQQMQNHFNDNDLFIECQTLGDITNQWITDLKNKKQVGVVFMDFHFSNVISPDLLISKLESYDFSHSAISTIRSFLSHSSSCHWTDTHCKLPRGSCMTHFLFSVYTNDLKDALERAHVVVSGSGSQLMMYHSANDYEGLKKVLRKESELVCGWLRENGMVLKTFTSTMIRSQTQMKQIQTHLRSTLSVKVKEFNWIRVLGVLLHDAPHLVWTS